MANKYEPKYINFKKKTDVITLEEKFVIKEQTIHPIYANNDVNNLIKDYVEYLKNNKNTKEEETLLVFYQLMAGNYLFYYFENNKRRIYISGISKENGKFIGDDRSIKENALLELASIPKDIFHKKMADAENLYHIKEIEDAIDKNDIVFLKTKHYIPKSPFDNEPILVTAEIMANILNGKVIDDVMNSKTNIVDKSDCKVLKDYITAKLDEMIGKPKDMAYDILKETSTSWVNQSEVFMKVGAKKIINFPYKITGEIMMPNKAAFIAQNDSIKQNTYRDERIDYSDIDETNIDEPLVKDISFYHYMGLLFISTCGAPLPKHLNIKYKETKENIVVMKNYDENFSEVKKYLHLVGKHLTHGLITNDFSELFEIYTKRFEEEKRNKPNLNLDEIFDKFERQLFDFRVFMSWIGEPIVGLGIHRNYSFAINDKDQGSGKSTLFKLLRYIMSGREMSNLVGDLEKSTSNDNFYQIGLSMFVYLICDESDSITNTLKNSGESSLISLSKRYANPIITANMKHKNIEQIPLSCRLLFANNGNSEDVRKSSEEYRRCFQNIYSMSVDNRFITDSADQISEWKIYRSVLFSYFYEPISNDKQKNHITSIFIELAKRFRYMIENMNKNKLLSQFIPINNNKLLKKDNNVSALQNNYKRIANDLLSENIIPLVGGITENNNCIFDETYLTHGTINGSDDSPRYVGLTDFDLKEILKRYNNNSNINDKFVEEFLHNLKEMGLDYLYINQKPYCDPEKKKKLIKSLMDKGTTRAWGIFLSETNFLELPTVTPNFNFERGRDIVYTNVQDKSICNSPLKKVKKEGEKDFRDFRDSKLHKSNRSYMFFFLDRRVKDVVTETTHNGKVDIEEISKLQEANPKILEVQYENSLEILKDIVAKKRKNTNTTMPPKKQDVK